MEITRRGLFLGLVGWLGARALPLEMLCFPVPASGVWTVIDELAPGPDLDTWILMRSGNGTTFSGVVGVAYTDHPDRVDD